MENKKVILFDGLMMLNDATEPSAEKRLLHFMTHIETHQAELGDKRYATIRELASNHADSCIAFCQHIKENLLKFKNEAPKIGLAANSPTQEYLKT